MNRLRILFFAAIAAGMYSAGARGQECPPSIDVEETVSTVVENWKAVASTSKHVLTGLDVIGGELPEDGGENLILAPQSLSDDEYVWKFRGPIGPNVVWMRCTYRDTHVRLTHRVDVAATECRQKADRSADSKEKARVRAFCSPEQKKGTSQ